MSGKRRVGILLAVVASVTIVILVVHCRHSGRLPEPTANPTFAGASSDLAHTQVVATLDEPITPRLVLSSLFVFAGVFLATWRRRRSLSPSSRP